MAPFFRRGVPSAPPPLQDAAEDAAHPPAPADHAPPPPPGAHRQRHPPRAPLRLEVDDPSLDSHPLDVPAPARPRVPVPSSPPTRAVSPEWTKFRAVVAKNWTLRTRGAALWCSLLELVVPLAFIALMCLPRLLIADEDRAATFHRSAPLDALSWSGRLPADGSGAYELVYSPSSSEEARAVARAAALDLACGDVDAVHPSSNAFTELPNGFDARNFTVGTFALAGALRDADPSFMQRAALASAVVIDLGAVAAVGDFERCRGDPRSCAERFVTPRAGGVNLTSPLLLPPGVLRARFCEPPCASDPSCVAPLVDAFLIPAETAETAEAYARRRAASGGPGVMAVVNLPANITRGAREVTYAIRVNATDVPTGAEGARWSSEKFQRWVVGENELWKKYWTYANVQRAFDQAIMSRTTDRNVRLSVSVKAFPFPAYATNLGSTFAAVFFGLVFVFAFVITVVVVVRSVAEERELRLREGMRIMGLSERAYWASWFVTSYAPLLLVSFLVAAAGAFPFRHTDWTVTFAFLALWTAQLVAFCFALVPLFASNAVAAVGSALVYVLTWIPGVAAVASEPMGSSAWTYSCAMMPAACIYQWGWIVSILENAKEGARWDTIGDNLLDGGEYAGKTLGNFSGSLIMRIVAANGAAYAVIAWFLNGTEMSRTFSWFFRRSTSAPSSAEDSSRDASADDEAALPGGVEPDPAVGEPAAIRARNLVVTFGGVAAVNGLRFVARRGRVTSLLGHNGAGKTTTISVLTGLLRGDGGRGRAFVDGADVETEMERARASMGVCPQFDVLWPTLTVREHLRLFARFRGIPASLAGVEADEKMAATGLTSKADRRAGTLSGGQRRALSLAIAFIGDPDVVLLDEPTSGMDPKSRRRAWDAIRRFRARTDASVLLTTHFMDEADQLSDRVAIMSRGRLACVGSPLFLKTEFGVGYTLVVDAGSSRVDAKSRSRVDDERERHHEQHHPRRHDHDHGDIAAVIHLVVRGVPGASFRSRDGGTLTFALPASSRASFPATLAALESPRGKTLGVRACGVRCATLEETFLNVAERLARCDGEATSSATSSATSASIVGGVSRRPSHARSASRVTPDDVRVHVGDVATIDPRLTVGDAVDHSDVDHSDVDHSDVDHSPRAAGFRLFARRFHACFWKRATHARRDAWTFAASTMVPVVFVLAGALASRVTARASVDPIPATMDASYLGNLPVAFASAVGGVPADSGDVLSRHFAVPLLDLPDHADATWECDDDSPVADACELSREACVGCTPAEETRLRTMDGYLLNASRPRATCRGGAPGKTTCAAIRLDAPGRLDAASPNDEGTAKIFEYELAVSPTAYHALPAAMSAVHAAIFDALHAAEDDESDASSPSPDKSDASSPSPDKSDASSPSPSRLTIINHPLPSTAEERADRAAMTRLLVALCAVLGLACLTAAPSAFLVRERVVGSKHLQLLAGLSPVTFWAATYAWDVMASSPALAAMLVVFAACGGDAFGGENLPPLAAALALFALSAFPLAYLLQRFFVTPAGSTAGQTGVAFFFGVAQLIASATLSGLAAAGVGRASDAWDACRAIFRWLPHYCVGRVVFNLAGGVLGRGVSAEGAATIRALDERNDPWAAETVGDELRAMAVTAVAYVAVLLLVETDGGAFADAATRAANAARRAFGRGDHHRTSTPDAASPSDPGVAAERARVFRSDPGEFPGLVVRDVRKRYPGVAADAVRGVSFGVSPGEIFGLLGVNGAGKTTTFKMLSGQLAPSSGAAFLTPRRGDAIRVGGATLSRARTRVGYCPQHDALQSTMTALEHLAFYGALRGFAPADAARSASRAASRAGLRGAAALRTIAANLSGGQRRKLSVAVALVGDPAVVLLDEPSTGMDPESRRGVWRALASAAAEGRAMVLTTHSTEEADALCRRIAIARKGAFRCLGTAQRLKAAHGEGYALVIRVSEEGDDATRSARRDELRAFVAREMPGAREETPEETPEGTTFLTPSPNLRFRLAAGASVARAFAAMEARDETLGIVEYQLGQTTLEEVFLRVAEEEETEEEETEEEETGEARARKTRL